MPTEVTLTSTFQNVIQTEQRRRLFSVITVRCRKCLACRKAFVSDWQHRSEREMAKARRCRMLTLTFEKPVKTFQAYCEMRRYFLRIRERYPDRKFKVLNVFERGEQGTKRLHIHSLICEYGDNIPKRVWGPRDSDKRGMWFAGFVKAKLVKRTPHIAAYYVLKYLLKDDTERFPGGRRISASPFWGSEEPTAEERAAKRDLGKVTEGRVGPVMSDPSMEHVLTFGSTWQEPRSGQRPETETHALGPGDATTCASYNQSPPSGSSSGDAKPPRGPPISKAAELAALWGITDATFRLIPPEEIPPGIAASWFGEQ